MASLLTAKNHIFCKVSRFNSTRRPATTGIFSAPQLRLKCVLNEKKHSTTTLQFSRSWKNRFSFKKPYSWVKKAVWRNITILDAFLSAFALIWCSKIPKLLEVVQLLKFARIVQLTSKRKKTHAARKGFSFHIINLWIWRKLISKICPERQKSRAKDFDAISTSSRQENLENGFQKDFFCIFVTPLYIFWT